MAILERRAPARELPHNPQARNPATWGVSVADLTAAPMAATNVDITVNDRNEVLAARRSDPYDLLYNAGGLSDEQHRASRRLFRDMATAAGANDGPPSFSMERIDAGRGDPGAPTQAAIDASKRVKLVLEATGPAPARVLKALNESMIAGEIRPWRAIVQLVPTVIPVGPPVSER